MLIRFKVSANACTKIFECYFSVFFANGHFLCPPVKQVLIGLINPGCGTDECPTSYLVILYVHTKWYILIFQVQWRLVLPKNTVLICVLLCAPRVKSIVMIAKTVKC